MYIFVTARNWIKLGLKHGKSPVNSAIIATRNWIKLGLKLVLMALPKTKRRLAIGLSWD